MGYLPPSVGPAGLTIPTYQAILADNLQGYLNIYGQNQYIGPDSAIYQLLSILSRKQFDDSQGLQLSYNQSSPQTAVGAGLDRIVKMNGIARLPYTFSTAPETITGTAGTVINNGVVQDVNGNQWALPPTVTIPLGGSIVVTVVCTTPGAVAAEPGDINIIATPVGGWTSTTNGASATQGLPIETDSQLRARQARSVALPSLTPVASTQAILQAIPGVVRVLVLENPTGAVDSYGNPPHSISVVVQAGAGLGLQIATAIYAKKTIGCYTNGTTTVNVTDPNTGYVAPINFTFATAVPIYVSISVHDLGGSTSATLDAIQTAIINYLNSLQIGEEITQSALYAAAMSVTPNLSAPIFSVRALTLDITPSPTATADITLLYTQIAAGIGGNVIATLV